jgi:hypothetical protein
LQVPLDLIQCLNSIENVTDLDKCISIETVPDYENPEYEIGSKYATDIKPTDQTSDNRT